MKKLYPPKVEEAVETLLTHPAVCTTTLRRAVEAHAARLGGADREVPELPEDLNDYVSKVALHAYKTTDGDVERLKEAGYSEDAIFEITLCAAMGAGLARMERGLALLKGGDNASDNS
jgi:hypothetical protein